MHVRVKENLNEICKHGANEPQSKALGGTVCVHLETRTTPEKKKFNKYHKLYKIHTANWWWSLIISVTAEERLALFDIFNKRVSE